MRFATAPVSYGVFGDLTVDGATTIDALLAGMAEAGFEGTELGPPGFFGPVPTLRDRFLRAGLTPVGAYVPLHTQDDGAVLGRDLDRFSITLDELAATNPDGLVILADEGDESLYRRPRKDSAQSLTGRAWERLVEVTTGAATRARERGLTVSFHPHIATYIELPEEIDRLLSDTDVDLTYDVGHIILAGGDGSALFDAWADRINHVHIKDVRPSVLEEARAAGREDLDAWWADVSTPLGVGDADLSSFCRTLRDSAYDGWVVIEQDRAPLTADSVEHVFAEQAANLNWLAGQLTHPTFLPTGKGNPKGTS